MDLSLPTRAACVRTRLPDASAPNDRSMRVMPSGGYSGTLPTALCSHAYIQPFAMGAMEKQKGEFLTLFISESCRYLWRGRSLPA